MVLKQRDVLAHPDRLEANVFGTPAKSRIIFGVAKGDMNVNTPIFICSRCASVAGLAKFPRYRAVSSSCCAIAPVLMQAFDRPLGDAILLGSGALDNVLDRQRCNRASGRVRCVLWGLSDASRRAQTKTIKRNCFSSAFCYCKEEACAERCDDLRRDILRPAIPARR